MHWACWSDKQRRASHPEEHHPLTHRRRHSHFSQGTWASPSSQHRGGGLTVLNLEDYKECPYWVLLRDASRADEQERYSSKEERKRWIAGIPGNTQGVGQDSSHLRCSSCRSTLANYQQHWFGRLWTRFKEHTLKAFTLPVRWAGSKL